MKNQLCILVLCFVLTVFLVPLNSFTIYPPIFTTIKELTSILPARSHEGSTDPFAAARQAATTLTLAKRSVNQLQNLGIEFDALIENRPTLFRANVGSPQGSYVWDFGEPGGQQITTQSPAVEYSYSSPGEYTIQLSVRDGTANFAFRQCVVVRPEPISGLTLVSSTIDDSPLNQLLFTAQFEQGNISSYRWSFGDGAVFRNLLESMPHTYFEPGVYITELTAFGPEFSLGKCGDPEKGRSVAHARELVAIHMPAQTVGATILVNSVNIQTEVRGLAVEHGISFSIQGMQEADEYKWTFGDGSEALSEGPRIMHVYNRSGTFPVSVIGSSPDLTQAAYGVVQVWDYVDYLPWFTLPLAITERDPETDLPSPTPQPTAKAAPAETPTPAGPEPDPTVQPTQTVPPTAVEGPTPTNTATSTAEATSTPTPTLIPTSTSTIVPTPTESGGSAQLPPTPTPTDFDGSSTLPPTPAFR